MFFVPFVLIPIAEGTERASSLLRKGNARGALYVLVAVILLFKPTSIALQHFYRPVMKEHIRPAIAYLSSHRLSSDTVYLGYLHGDAIPAFDYSVRLWFYSRCC
jgi:hypothetical protein